ncbi:hypothetical protein [uncultured Sphingomonas sp.]|uniref:hypothetical protein n=1 Tax=uncultured Sphingomonas sp. TaxID=158754 RepID=UPI0035CAF075
MIHHNDRTWQAVCGQRDHSPESDDFRIVGVNHLFTRQADLEGLETLAPAQIAEWIDGDWIVTPFDEDDPD